MAKVVTRFAPSPTGFMHIGGVRTALFAWLWARKNNGTFILRIEDTDQKREVEGSIAHIQESLHWLNIDWDYGPDAQGPFGSCIQSERLESYKAAARQLIDTGFAYPDPYTAEQLDAMRKEAEAAKKPFLFREHRPETFDAWDGTRSLRFKVPEIKKYSWHDEVRGDLSAGEEALDDFILIKADGYPTYNFAHIIDDTAMGVTHIMRGDEFISSTPRFLSLYDALGVTYPAFVTLPPILRDDKTKKLGKRDGAKDILEYRNEGYLQDAMRNFLAFIGWNPGTEQELFSNEELLQAFDITKIQTHGGVFNEEKLRWYNREYLLKMSEDEFATDMMEHLHAALNRKNITWDEPVARALVPLMRERVSVWSDIDQLAGDGELDFFFADPTPNTLEIAQKNSTPEIAQKHLTELIKLLENLPEDAYKSPESVKAAIWPYAEAEGRGAVLWPFRYSLSGRAKSPDPFLIASIIGKDAAVRRVKKALELLGAKG